MTDTDRIDYDSDDDPSGRDGTLDDWDEYSDSESEFEDFLDWLNRRA